MTNPLKSLIITLTTVLRKKALNMFHVIKSYKDFTFRNIFDTYCFHQAQNFCLSEKIADGGILIILNKDAKIEKIYAYSRKLKKFIEYS